MNESPLVHHSRLPPIQQKAGVADLGAPVEGLEAVLYSTHAWETEAALHDDHAQFGTQPSETYDGEAISENPKGCAILTR